MEYRGPRLCSGGHRCVGALGWAVWGAMSLLVGWSLYRTFQLGQLDSPTAGTLCTMDLITLGRGLGVPGRGHLGEPVWVSPWNPALGSCGASGPPAGPSQPWGPRRLSGELSLDHREALGHVSFL